MKFSMLRSIFFLIVCFIISPKAYAANYQVDDGIGTTSVGLTYGGNAIYMNQFFTTVQYDYISSIEIAWGEIYNTNSATISIWSDPNQDKSPLDKISLYSAIVDIQNVNSDIFNIYSVPNIYVSGSFFVGFEIYNAAGEYPARIDTSTSMQQSWVMSESAGLTPDLIDNYGFPGNWMIRANGGETSPVPEPSTMSLLGIGLLGLVGIGRRSRQ